METTTRGKAALASREALRNRIARAVPVLVDLVEEYDETALRAIARVLKRLAMLDEAWPLT